VHRCLGSDAAARALPLAEWNARSLLHELRAQAADVGAAAKAVGGAFCLLEDACPEEAKPPVLSHGDLSPWNIVVTDAGLVLIDWDHARWAPPQADVAFASSFANGLCRNRAEQAAFDEAYAAAGGCLDHMPFHRALDAAFQVTAALSVGECPDALDHQFRQALWALRESRASAPLFVRSG